MQLLIIFTVKKSTNVFFTGLCIQDMFFSLNVNDLKFIILKFFISKKYCNVTETASINILSNESSHKIIQ